MLPVYVEMLNRRVYLKRGGVNCVDCCEQKIALALTSPDVTSADVAKLIDQASTAAAAAGRHYLLVEVGTKRSGTGQYSAQAMAANPSAYATLHSVLSEFNVLFRAKIEYRSLRKARYQSDRKKSHDRWVVVVGLDLGRACDRVCVDG
jgi:hypothetical protein